MNVTVEEYTKLEVLAILLLVEMLVATRVSEAVPTVVDVGVGVVCRLDVVGCPDELDCEVEDEVVACKDEVEAKV